MPKGYYILTHCWNIEYKQKNSIITHLGVHQAQGQAHGDAQKPNENNFESDPPTCFIAAKSHWVS